LMYSTNKCLLYINKLVIIVISVETSQPNTILQNKFCKSLCPLGGRGIVLNHLFALGFAGDFFYSDVVLSLLR
jgi:hypothetical protein